MRQVSEEEILSAMTPSGGWTRETLEGWGVSWPPKKGWKERLISGQASVQTFQVIKRWPGRVRPVNDTDLAHFYWDADIGTKEICEAFDIEHACKIASQAGPAQLLGCECKHCSGPIIVKSRSEAEELLRRAEGYRSEWFDGHVCSGCVQRDREDAERRSREKYAAQQAREHELKTMPYREYLRTPEWKDRADRARRSVGYRCQMCSGGGQLHVHHRTYVRRGDEWNKDLIVLCADCHELFHAHGKLAEGGRAA